MFELSDETRTQIIELARTHFSITPEQHSDEDINNFIDEVVSLVKRQFGF
jgi:hypothetical protein